MKRSTKGMMHNMDGYSKARNKRGGTKSNSGTKRKSNTHNSGY